MAKKLFSILTATTISLYTVCTTYSTGMKAAAKEPIEVVSKRTEYSKVFDNGDGTYTAYSNAAPIHYSTNDGWKEIDNTLIEKEDGYVHNKANSFDVLVPKAISLNNEEQTSTIIKNDKLELAISLKELSVQDKAVDDNEASYAEINNEVYDLSDGLDLPSAFKDALQKTSATAIYKSIANDLDFSIAVNNSGITESFIINTNESVPEMLTYSLVVDEGVNLEKSDNNELLFIKDDEVVMNMVPFVDSSEDVNYDIHDTEEGYDLILYPLYSINELGNIILPRSFGVEFQYDSPNTAVYNSQSNPSTVYSNLNLKIGNITSDNYNTLVSVQDDLSLYTQYATITDATYCIYVPTSFSGSHKINVYSHNTALPGSSWNNTHPFSSNYSLISSNSISTGIGWKLIDVTSLMQSWLNYYHTSSVVGIANNGFTLTLTENSPETVVANSPRANTNKPIFRVTFLVNYNTYTLEYAPQKYNNVPAADFQLGTLYNFQRRMNCYAYALQIYNNTCDNSVYYLAQPGEFGIAYNPNVNSYSELSSSYQSSNFNNAEVRQQFIEDRMKEDAQAMNFQISDPFRGTYSSIDGKMHFALPNDFNESTGRIIAMTSKIDNQNKIECHFYLRNGNYSCPNHTGNCSMWSHKRGNQVVRNISISNSNVILCDQNIGEYINDAEYYHDARYYIITKDTCVYNSWHSSNPSTGPTPYQQ